METSINDSTDQMMELISIIPIMAAIVQFAILIVFFMIANNVSEIKKQINRKPSIKEYLNMAKEEKYVGNKDKAKEYLLRARFLTEGLGVQVYMPELIAYSNQVIEQINKELEEL